MAGALRIMQQAAAISALEQQRAEIEARLAGSLGRGDERLSLAMRHMLLAPAKRARGLLVVVSTAHHGGAFERGGPGAVAVEMVHAASLILDDLPAMDDAAMRRGRPATHRLFGEATAILAAIALMSRAFGVIAEDDGAAPAQRIAASAVLSDAVGLGGMVGGQAGDIAWAGTPDAALVDAIHRGKTASLFAASAELGAIAADADAATRATAAACGLSLGLALQAYDDVLDATGDTARAGKTTGQDGVRRPSLVAALGLPATVLAADAHLAAARDAAGGGLLARYCDDLAALLRDAVDAARYPVDRRSGAAR